MKNNTPNSRRDFLATTVKGAALVGVGATFAGALLPLSADAQTGIAPLRNKIAELGTASLQTSQLALTKAANPQVKLFAKFEAAEQEAMGKVLKDMGATVPAPSADGKAILAKLQSLSGAAFDKAFMIAQVETHKKLFAAVTAVRTASKDAKIKHAAGLVLGTITEHTERGQMLLSSLA